MGSATCKDCNNEAVADASTDLTVKAGRPYEGVQSDALSGAKAEEVPPPVVVSVDNDPAMPEEVKPEPTPEVKPEVKPAPMPEAKPVLTPVPEAPAPAPAASKIKLDVQVTRGDTKDALGMVIDNKYFVPNILIKSITDGAAKKTGKLQAGDLITAVDGSSMTEDGAPFTDLVRKSQSPTFSIHRHCWDVTLEKKAGVKLGMTFAAFEDTAFSLITGVADGEEAARFNAANPGKAIQANDLILGVNGSFQDATESPAGYTYRVFREEATKDQATIGLTLLRRP